MSAEEFLSFEEGMEAFKHYYGKHYEELKELCIFIENEKGDKECLKSFSSFFISYSFYHNDT